MVSWDQDVVVWHAMVRQRHQMQATTVVWDLFPVELRLKTPQVLLLTHPHQPSSLLSPPSLWPHDLPEALRPPLAGKAAEPSFFLL